jgi:hypothetical protein
VAQRWSASEWVKAMATVRGWATAPASAQASDQELAQDPAQATATVTALAQQHAYLNRHTQLPKTKRKQSRTRSRISNLYET